MNDLLTTSVIISTYTIERKPDLLHCISSIKSQTLQPLEIVLVLDPHKELLEFYGSKVHSSVRIVAADEVGLSHARNKGVTESRGNIVAFIDDDAIADKRWLENMVANYEDPQIMGVGGLVAAQWEGGRPEWFPGELDWIVGCSYSGLPKTRTITRNPIGCNMSFRKKVFDEIGYFRSDIGRLGKNPSGCEETELSIRILREIPDAKIIYDPSAIVYHKVNKERKKLKYLWTRSFFEGVSKARIDFEQKSGTRIRSTERSYLRFLLGAAIPSRLKQIYRFQNMCQLITLLMSTIAVFVGFLSGKVMKGDSGKT